ncbi:aspartate--tRNA(Asn) ligase [Pyrolobus fumarii]|uniref:aspartate--tRNA(Asn) ligase n=1 Tax=Pyrolobus fumarii TaxID=54252 RepID=UPI0014329E1F|nr:aspartate--tRNA(Asn) ligase [Pyrolobus fumarii]
MPGLLLEARRYIADVLREGRVGEKYVIAGWVEAVRRHGGVVFVVVRDRSGRMQVVAKKNVAREAWETARELSRESVIAVKGVLVESKAALGGKELQAEEILVLNEAEPLPIEPGGKTASLAIRLRYRWIDLREPRHATPIIAAAVAAEAASKFFAEQGFIEIFTPKIVASATEGGAEVFPIIYFEKEAFLAQSPQLYKQMGVISGLERVYEIGPAFRAEKHHTVRHLTEFTSVDFEMGFIKSYEDVMKVVEGAVTAMIEAIQSDPRTKPLLEEYYPQALELKPPREYPRVPIDEAYRLLREAGLEIEEDEDLGTEGEKKLGEIYEKEYGAPLVFVTMYPWSVRPFYTMKAREEPWSCPEEPRFTNPKRTYSFDLLFKGLEVATGGQREHCPRILEEQLREKGLNPAAFDWYLEMFRHGAPPHGGAGIGLERVVMQLLGLGNIREARFVPRDPEHLKP